MRLLTCLLLGLLGALTDALTLPPDAQNAESAAEALIDRAKRNAFEHIDQQATQLKARGLEPTCTKDNLAIRKEYGKLSKAEKLDYVASVKCLQQLPARTPREAADGARSRVSPP